jgi:predicted HicB family RNase H-like nuclease
MARKRGRPPVAPEKAKAGVLQVRVEASEKQAFQEAAQLAGIALSAWVRERLRLAAREELEEAGRSAAFLPNPGKPD